MGHLREKENRTFSDQENYLQASVDALRREVANLRHLNEMTGLRIDRIGEYCHANKIELPEPADFCISAIQIIDALRREREQLIERLAEAERVLRRYENMYDGGHLDPRWIGKEARAYFQRSEGK